MSKRNDDMVLFDLYMWLEIGSLGDLDLQYGLITLYDAWERVPPGDHERVARILARLAVVFVSEANRRGVAIHPPLSSDGPNGFDALPPTPRSN